MADVATAWTQIVLAEAAVGYAYGIAAAQLDPPQRGTAVAILAAHKQARDDALSALVAAGGDAPELPTLYALPTAIGNSEQAQQLLALVEGRLAANYADLMAALPITDRPPILESVLTANDRALLWGAAAGPWGTETA